MPALGCLPRVASRSFNWPSIILYAAAHWLAQRSGNIPKFRGQQKVCHISEDREHMLRLDSCYQ
jgi:hypothetical protein